MNKLLQRQLQKHFGNAAQVPENLAKLLKVISESYDHYEKDRKMIERSIELSSKEMIELNNQIKKSGKAELEKAHNQVKTLFENIDEVLYSVDMVSFKILQISAACEKVTGYTAEDFFADPDLWRKVVFPEDKDISKQQVQLLYQGKRVRNQYRIIHKNKGIRWIENKIIPTLDETGRLVRIDAVTNDITERKVAEKKLEESISILETTIESTADGILVLDFEGKIIRFNKKFAELWRIPLEILETGDNEKAIAYVSDQMEDPEEFVSKIKESQAQQEEINFSIRKFKDGRIFQRYSQPRLINGNCVGRVISFRDITEQKKTEKALCENEKHLRQIIDLVPHFIFAKDAKGKFILANEAVAEAYGCRVEDLIGKCDSDFNSNKEEVEHFIKEDLEVINSGTAKHNIEEMVTDTAGKVRILSTTKIPYTVPGFDIPGLLGVSVDISESKKADEALRLAQFTIENTTHAIYWIKSDGSFHMVNNAATQMLGFSFEELMQLNVPGIDPFYNKEVWDGFWQAIINQKYMRLITKHIRKDGTLIDVQIDTHYFRFENLEMSCAFVSDITERKKAEDAIKESEEKYKALVENAPEALVVLDVEKRKFISVSESAVKLFKMPKEELLKIGPLEVSPEYQPGGRLSSEFAIEKIQDAVAGNKPVFEWIHCDASGNLIPCEVCLVHMPSEKNVLLRASIFNITERKKTEKLIKESELRYRSLIEQATDAICIADASLKFIDVNPYACRVLGYSKEESLELSVTDIIFLEDLQTNPFKFDETKSEEIIRNERRFKRKDGTSVLMEVSTKLMEDGRFIMFGHDITERKKAETVLKENEGQLSVAAQIAKLGYWEFDVLKGLFTFNDQFYAIFKTTAEEVGGYTMTPDHYASLFLHPDDAPMVGQEVANAINSQDPYYSRQIEHRIRYANGETGYMAVRYFIVKDEQGRTVKTFGANQDITERKRGEETLRISEAQLEQKNKELELKNKELEQFAYVASHDLQEPLRTTSSFAELLQQQYKGKLDEKADKYLTFINQSSDRMKVLIKDLLDYSRIGRKKESEQVDCNIILQEVLADIDVAIKETQAEIKFCKLPVIKGSPTEIKQLFQNLVINAIKFKNENEAPVININAKKKNHYWEFSCADNGIGISDEHRERIFVIFQRLHTRNEYEGSGIGLAHCKKIVELHGGRIWVESVFGSGSTFYFTLQQNNV